MFSEQVPKYTIDLTKPENERWAHVIAAEVDDAGAMSEAIEEAIVGVTPRFIWSPISRMIESQYRAMNGSYLGEMEAWAKALERPAHEVISMNLAYELSHVSQGFGIFGCTAGIVQIRKNLVHVRSMDWEVPGVGEATRVFWFKDGDRRFVSVGILGYVGVLSGMLPGAYSVSINWAPPIEGPGFDHAPAITLRHALEHCDTYEQVVRFLSCTPLATSVFYTVCGTEPGQACVIERTARFSTIREIEGRVLTQGNHYMTRELWPYNQDQDLVDDSCERMGWLEHELLEAHSFDEASFCLDAEPVFNADTEQQMAFCPKSGKMKVWRWLDR